MLSEFEGFGGASLGVLSQVSSRARSLKISACAAASSVMSSPSDGVMVSVVSGRVSGSPDEVAAAAFFLGGIVETAARNAR